MSLLKSKQFKYFKNFVIGVGAALVMLGALYKVQSWEMPTIMGQKVDLLTVGLMTEFFLFLLLGILPPEKDYYWEKVVPGLDDYNSQVNPLLANNALGGGANDIKFNSEALEGKMDNMVRELESMSKSLGSLKALQEVDFTQTGDQVKAMNNFYTKMNEAMSALSDSVEDTKKYKQEMASLNTKLSSLNGVYGNVLNAFSGRSNGN